MLDLDLQLKIKDQENAAKTIRKGFHDEICISGGEPRHQLAFAFHRLLCTPADEKDAGRWAKFNEDLTNQKGKIWEEIQSLETGWSPKNSRRLSAPVRKTGPVLQR
jgi:hypothetical protein